MNAFSKNTTTKEMKRKKSQEKLLFFFHPHFHKCLKGQGGECTENVNLSPLTYLCYISSGKVVFHSLYEFSCSSGSCFKVDKGESATEVNKRVQIFLSYLKNYL